MKAIELRVLQTRTSGLLLGDLVDEQQSRRFDVLLNNLLGLDNAFDLVAFTTVW